MSRTIFRALILSNLAVGAAAATAPQVTTGSDALREAWQLQIAGRWAACDSLAVMALERAEKSRPPDSSAMALALELRSAVRLGQAQFRDSLATAGAARSLAIMQRLAQPDTALWIETHAVLGRVLMEQERPDSALVHFARARQLCSPTVSGSDSMFLDLWTLTGRAFRRSGKSDSALVALENARRLAERLHGPEDSRVGAALAEMGATYTSMDRFDDAGSLLERAIQLLERSLGPMSPELATPLSQLASVQYLCGDIAGSIETLERAVVIREKDEGPASPRVVPLRYNIALRLFDFGDYAGARARFEALLEPARAAFGDGSTRTEMIRMEIGGAAMLMGDTAAAMMHLTKAREALGRKPLDAQHTLNYVDRMYGHLLRQRGELAAARAILAGALARERSSGHPSLPIMSALTEELLTVQMAAGDSVGADSTVREMAAMVADSSLHNTIPYANYRRLRARAEAWRGQQDAAWADALEAERIERARLLLNIRVLPDRRALELAEGLAEPLDQLASLARVGSPDAIATAWDRLVRWRGMVAAEVSGRRPPRGAAVDPALFAAHARWLEARERSARMEVANGGASGDSAAAARLERARTEAEEAESRYDQLASARGVAHDTATADFAHVRAALRADQALVSVMELASSSDTAQFVAFVTIGPAGSLHWIDLGRSSEINLRLSAWRAALATPPAPGHGREAERTCRRLGQQVRSATWDRLHAAVGGAREVVLVADGALVDLPWQALPEGRDAYLAETGPAIQLPGAERELLAPSAVHGRGLLAMGDPDFDATGGRTAPASSAAMVAMRGPFGDCRAPEHLTLESLPGARREIDDVAKSWDATHPDSPAERRVGEEATEVVFKTEAPGREVLHVATHGIVWGDACAPVHAGMRGVGGVEPILEPSRAKTGAAANQRAVPPAPPPATSPWRGRQVWLALAGANRAQAGSLDDNEGLLTAEEIVTLDLRGVEWVVLSACQSGVGQEWPHEGSIGMRRAFRLAGAHTVIASQWPIADDATREWMRALYGARAGGEAGAFEAMRSASRTVLRERRRSHRSTHPFYWAAFVANGR